MNERKGDISGLVRVFRMIQNSFAYFGRKYNLSMTEMMILLDTVYHKQVTVTQLAESLGIPKSTVSRLVEQMVQKQCLNRVRPDHNRRIVQISVTDSFSEKMDLLKDDSSFQQLLEQDLPKEAGQKAIALLLELVDILEQDHVGT